MRYLIDKIALSGTEFRVIANTDSSIVEVWGDQIAYEFADRTTALSYLAKAYKTAQDLRNLLPGQEVVLDMADGTARTVSVINNDNNAATVVDSKSGESLQIPHLQNAGSPKVLPKTTTSPDQSGVNKAPEPGSQEGGEATNIQPGTGVVLSKKKSKPWWKEQEQWEKKNPPKEYMEEVTVYPDKTRKEKWVSAAVDPATVTKPAKPDFRGLQKPNRPGDLSQLNISRPEKTVFPAKPSLSKGAALKQADYPHRHPQHCKHDGNYLQRKDPSDAEKECPSCGMVYAASRQCSHCSGTGTVYRRKTTLGKGRGERCRNCGGSGSLEDRAALSKRALTKIAQPPALSGQPESAQPADSSMPTGPQQAPAQEQAQPAKGEGTGGKRPLSRHEIITEAEILIRNALFKGIKIGTMDLVKYMQEQYGNTPEELYEGATKAWEKVQWEEEDAFQVAKGPGPEQKNQPGLDNPALEGEESPNPVSPEQVAQLPQSGPTQVKI